MPRPLFAFLVILLGALARGEAVTEPRNWISVDGKKLHGTLLRASKTSVFVKVTRGGKKVTVPLERLAPAERAAVLAWLKTNPEGIVPPRPPFDWPDRFNGEQQPKITYLAYDEKQKAHVFRAKHYDLYSDEKLSEGTVAKCAAVFDSVVGALDALPLGLNPIPPEGAPRYRALLVSSSAQYHARGGPPNSAGVYIPAKNLTMVPYKSMGIVKKGSNWVFDGTQRDFGVLKHELTHQSLVRRWGFLPVWFHEGIAEYMQAMPYRSGQFLFTNPGAAMSKHLRDSVGRVWTKEFPCVPPKEMLHMEHRTWNAAGRADPRRAWRNYASAEVMVWFFMHVDDEGDGAHFIKWIHELKTANTQHRKNWSAKRAELTEKHLLRDRSWEDLQEELRKAALEKGVRIAF